MLLPHILSATKYYEENGDPKGDKGWDIEILNNIPQQTKEYVQYFPWQHACFVIYTIIFNIVNITFLCSFSGDGIFFLIKFAEDLMHNHPMDTLTGEQMDWFREKMAVELFFHKELPM